MIDYAFISGNAPWSSSKLFTVWISKWKTLRRRLKIRLKIFIWMTGLIISNN